LKAETERDKELGFEAGERTWGCFD